MNGREFRTQQNAIREPRINHGPDDDASAVSVIDCDQR
jgi:hypothetical protein